MSRDIVRVICLYPQTETGCFLLAPGLPAIFISFTKTHKFLVCQERLVYSAAAAKFPCSHTHMEIAEASDSEQRLKPILSLLSIMLKITDFHLTDNK